MLIKIPLKLKASGFLTLGPKPGTELYDQEQAALREGRPFDYEAHGTRLYIEDGDDEQPAPTLNVEPEEPEPPTLPSPGHPG